MQSKTQSILTDKNYKQFIYDIKEHIQKSQIKAALSVNSELIFLYWDIAKKIIEMQKKSKWGDGFLRQMSKDLYKEFPDIKGFSYTNLRYIKQWYSFWRQIAVKTLNAKQIEAVSICQQVVGKLAQIPWGHNLVILSSVSDYREALFYVQKTIEHNWSRAVLNRHIDLQLYAREGKAITNFDSKLPKTQSDLANQVIKDPYTFDFLSIRDKYDEREIEDELVKNIAQFLLELGAGFSFIGRQYKLVVSNEDFYIDLLFYHTKLHCYVVVELKAVEFKADFTGKLGFYVSAVDEILKTPQDNPTIGLLICKSKKKTIVEYALKSMKSPIGVSDYEITKVLPKNFKSSLPSIADIEKELKK